MSRSETRAYWETRLAEAIKGREPGCSCRLVLYNGDVDSAARIEADTEGCKLHCDHPRMRFGSKCRCGQIV
jgi:hypothetical protein